MDKITKIIASSLLLWMFAAMFASYWNDSATFDEVAHIPAGYSYLTQKDYRLNPEHPPLIKDLSAVPLLFLNLNFPSNIPAWASETNGQWEVGRVFLYEIGNDADKIIRLARIPVMIMAILFGWLLFKWSRRMYGNKVGLLTLFFYAMSPTIIAHGRYVTTDVAASLGFFIGIVTFLNFLRSPNRKNILVAGAAFGIAQLLKFSTMLLAPIYIIIAVLWVILNNWSNLKKTAVETAKTIGKIALIGAVGLMVVWPVYQFHILDYPAEKQISDIEDTLTAQWIQPLKKFTLFLSDNPVTRPWGQYMFGILMVMQRAGWGNSVYFLGTVSAEGTPGYFPLLYLVKEHFAFHILTLIALVFAVKSVLSAKEKNLRVVVEWMRDNFALTASMIFIFIYFMQSITSNLNIGVRHIMPTLPFIYFLVARQTIKWSKVVNVMEPSGIFEWINHIYHAYIKSLEKYSLVAALMLWMFATNIISFPHYLSFYNILGGGIENGYKIATDSNYDWGQDLNRLKKFVEKNNIDKIAVDYFGGGSPRYSLGEKFEPWWSARGPIEKGWLAVSANTIQGAMAKPIKGFEVKYEDSYWWLKGKEPVARTGTSIFIYKF